MKPSKLYDALQALIGERVPLHIWVRAGLENRRSSLRSRAVSTTTSLTCGQFNSIQWISETAADLQWPDRVGATEVSPDERQGHLVSR